MMYPQCGALALVVGESCEQRVGPEPRVEADQAHSQAVGVHAPDPNARAFQLWSEIVPRQPIGHRLELLRRVLRHDCVVVHRMWVVNPLIKMINGRACSCVAYSGPGADR